ncbi:putative sh3 domain protein [Erysiphe neolycopersici]|uniref:Putative sh3 domain protein n=1 Tax=Erysiphe neolycopersici TaxID=212602 RepID=A0A420I7Y1_9PEZI|nr:putative sh3 domain protein [Erysiphe neolycopersici]
MNREWDDGESQPSRKQTDTDTDIDTDTSNKTFPSQNNRKSTHVIISPEDPSAGHDGSMGEDDEVKNGDVDDGTDDDMMDKISSSPSIDDEDIDFEFVYALHTFIATIEGQANATKGDTMVLLDDSNSYWWLVRVVKDSSIGYLPAEHIETPTERLARLNKHRNIDLTSSMLGDQPDRYKTPLIKAFRKRSTKTVAFTDPTYFEASENDYTTEEDEEDQEYFGHVMQRDQVSDSKEKERDLDENISIEPLKISLDTNETAMDEIERDRSPTPTGIDNSVTNDESQSGRSISKSRNGPVRNAEPIFPDDSVETRKITLTPDLLRDNSSPTAVRVSNEFRETKRPSQERLERDSSDKVKDKKDRKDKKSGMLSGLFKRKDRKNKSIDEDIEEVLGITQANESSEISPVLSKESDRITDDQSERSQDIQAPTNRLQKQSSFENSTSRDASRSRESKDSESSKLAFKESIVDVKSPQSISSSQSNTIIEAILEKDEDDDITNEGEISDSVTSPLVNAVSKSRMESNINSKPIKLKQAKSPVELDDFGSSQDKINDLSAQVDGISEPLLQDNSADKSQVQSQTSMVANSGQGNPSSPGSTASPESTTLEGSISKTGAGSSTTLATPNFTWSDNNLKSFFDDDNNIKDMLIVIYDNTGVVPAGPQHPITGNLYKDECIKLTDIANRLDHLLEDWLARKSRSLSGR